MKPTARSASAVPSNRWRPGGRAGVGELRPARGVGGGWGRRRASQGSCCSVAELFLAGQGPPVAAAQVLLFPAVWGGKAGWAQDGLRVARTG